MGIYLNRLGKLTISHSFILSNFNYYPVIWHFCSEANTKKMEKIQERALKFIYTFSTDICDVRIKFLIHKLSIVTPRSLTSSSVFIILPFKLKAQ
jgi:hypothetical protein